MPPRNGADLERAVEEVANPLSPSFRNYLTPEEFAARYGASPEEYEKVLAWARERNLEVEAHPNRLVAHVSGSAAVLEAALHVQFEQGLREDGSVFYSADREPTLDLDVPVKHISHLENYVLPEAAWGGGSGGGGSLSGRDFRNAYASCTTLTGAGQSIGIVSLGSGVSPFDFAAYASAAGFFGVLPIVTVGPAGTGGDLEDTLDAEMALSMAPGAQLIAFRGTLSQVLANMAARPDVKQLTSSYFQGIDETARTLLSQMALQGQSYFQASGDHGALVAGSIGGVGDVRAHPAVINVGGTELVMNSPGVSYASESGWGPPVGFAMPGSTGGILSGTVNTTGVGTPIPSHQRGVANALNAASDVYRNVPDVSMPANGVEILLSGSRTLVGGTSAAAPLWAGFMALVNQQAHSMNLASMGAANPAFYLLAKDPFTYGAAFNDVTVGSNASPFNTSFAYNATSGYDLVTGIGTPKCGLISALAGISSLASPPSVSARGPGVLELFGRQNNLVVHRTYRNGQGFGPWQAMPPVSAGSAPAAVSWSPNRIDAFVRGTSGELRHAWWNDGGDWSYWEDLGCCFDTAPTVASWGPNRLDVFIGRAGQLHHRWFGAGWSGWESLGGAMTSAPTAVSWGSGRIDVFARGTAGDLVHKWYNNSGGWSGWESLGGWFQGSPGVASWGPNRLDIFVAASGSAWHLWYNSGWGSWEPIGGSVAPGMTATSFGFGRLDIFANDPSSHLTHQWYNNTSGWGSWETL